MLVVTRFSGPSFLQEAKLSRKNFASYLLFIKFILANNHSKYLLFPQLIEFENLCLPYREKEACYGLVLCQGLVAGSCKADLRGL